VRKKIGECLIQAGLLGEADLAVALAEHKRTGERVGTVLVRLGLVSEAEMARTLAYQLGFPYLSPADEPPEPSAVVLIPKEVALKRVCVAMRLDKNVLTVAMADPLLFSLIQDLEFQTGYRIRQVVAPRADILEAISGWYPDKALVHAPLSGAAAHGGPGQPGGLVQRSETERPDDEVFESETATSERVESAPIVDLVDLVINGAVTSRASDVHIEPMDRHILVRHRLDGILKEVMELPRWVHDGLVARLKVMAGMDIAEKRLPQDGRIRVKNEERDVDFRVSSLRTMFGEKIVLRVLDHRKGAPRLEELGLVTGALDRVRYFLRHQHGMILVVGPTGSGKTTTLASALASIRSGRTNILTIEDPVEYQISGVNQTQINEKAKLTFASALRAILRQDPDVILVGEIRDQETVRIALQAAQTGHLVLSTLHTEDAPSAISRLTDLGAEPFVIASALVGVVAQRLVRRVCPHCRKAYVPAPDVLRALSVPPEDAARTVFYQPAGCDECNQTGYRGRVGIYEVMTVTDKVRRLIAQRATEDAIRDAALGEGMQTLAEDGLVKVKTGYSTPEELLRVVTEVRDVRASCPGCGGTVSVDFVACPHCGRRLSGGCPKCGRSIQAAWNVCPYCTTALGRSAGRSWQEEPTMAAANVAEFRKP
jgi:type IV pilus assembly protein PilB